MRNNDGVVDTYTALWPHHTTALDSMFKDVNKISGVPFIKMG